MPATWDEMRTQLMARVFYDFSPEQVEASNDLVGDGFLNSTSVLVVLGLLDDELSDGTSLTEVSSRDTASLAAMKSLYLQLLGDRQTGGVP